MTDPIAHCTRYQRQLFTLLLEFFERATGCAPEEFATFETFGDTIRSRAEALSQRVRAALQWADDNVRPFYAQEAANAFAAARQFGGLKLVQGGGSGFFRTQFESVTGSLLYADTILVPDPVMPWFETPRDEERFPHVKLLEAAFFLLHLRPFVMADIPVPPIFVFPSMEKLLEDHDPQTQAALKQLLVDLISHFVEPEVLSFDDLGQLVRSCPDQFIARVDANHLFVSPGGTVGEPVTVALDRYEAGLATWRSSAWLEQFRELPRAARLLNGIYERIIPQHHLIENSDELNSHPLLSIEQQAHYFRLISQTDTARLAHLGLIDPKRHALVQAMGNRRLMWLNRVPPEALVELRRNNENAAFRDRLLSTVNTMHNAVVQDTDRVAAEVASEISAMVGEHDREMRSIQERYQKTHGKTAVAAWAALGATLIPSLAPFLGPAAPFAVAAKYAWDKIDERNLKRMRSRSLMGVLAQTARSEDNPT